MSEGSSEQENLLPDLDHAFDQTFDQTLDYTLASSQSDAPAIFDALLATDSERPERYERFDTLGSGAMGSVDLARDRILFRKVAYKELKPELATTAVYLNRFYKEAQITAQLEHPGIVPVYSM